MSGDLLRNAPDYSAWIAGGKDASGNVSRHYTARADDRPGSDTDARLY